MPSLRELKYRFALWLALLAAVMCWTPAMQAQDTATRPTEQEITQAISKLKADPNLAVQTKINTLHWMNDKDKPPEHTRTPGWLRWIRSLFLWLAQTSRVLLWTVITILVAMVVIFLLRVFGNFQRGPRLQAADHLPSHVRDLDIRPESLPADIGAAVWQMWQQHDHRNALSLLYRGLLSRLVHQYRVPIRDSSTESQCLQLARDHLQTSQSDYVSRALKVWQFAVYGARLPDEQEVQQLCEQFAVALAAPSASSVVHGT